MNHINRNPYGKLFKLYFKNIPKTIKYLNLQDTLYWQKEIDFLDSIKHIPVILIDKELYKQQLKFFSKLSNFYSKTTDEILPAELTNENLFYKDTKYQFF